MISRISLSVALVAAANANYVKVKALKDMGGTTNAGGSCSVTFGTAGADGSAWVGVASITGQTGNTVLASGTGLCAAGKATSDDYAMDYSISLSSTETVLTPELTGLGLTCPNGSTDSKLLESDLKAQIGNNAVAKGLGDLKTVLTSGTVTFISNTVNEQSAYNTSITTIVSSFQTDNDQIVDDLSDDITALMSSMGTAVTVTAKSAWDTYATTECDSMKTDATSTCSSKATTWTTIKTDAEAKLDVVVADCKTQMESVWTGLTTDVTGVTTEAATTLATTVTAVKTTTLADKDALDVTIAGQMLDQKTIEKTVYKSLIKGQSTATKGLSTIEKDAKNIGKDTLKATKDAMKTSSTASTAALSAMDTAINTAETEITTLLGSDSGKKKCEKAVAKLHKSGKTIVKKQGKETTKAAKTATKELTTSTKTAVKTQKTAAKTYKDGIKTGTKAIIGDTPANPYPIFVSTSNYDYKSVTANLEVSTVTVTRIADGATSTCQLMPAYETSASGCSYTAFDELWFDYICTMSTFTYKGSAIDCTSDDVRPSVSCYNAKKSEISSTVAAAIAASTTVTCLAADTAGNVVCTDSATNRQTTTASSGSSVTVTLVTTTADDGTTTETEEAYSTCAAPITTAGSTLGDVVCALVAPTTDADATVDIRETTTNANGIMYKTCIAEGANATDVTDCTALNNGNITSTNSSTLYWVENTSAGVFVQDCDPADALDGDAAITRCTQADESYILTNTDGTITSCGIPDPSTTGTTVGDIFCQVTAGTTIGTSYTWDDNTEQLKVEECAALDEVTTSDTYNQIVCSTDTSGQVLTYDTTRTLVSDCDADQYNADSVCEFAATGYVKTTDINDSSFVTVTSTTDSTVILTCFPIRGLADTAFTVDSQTCLDGVTGVSTTYEIDADNKQTGTGVQICQAAVASGTNIGDVSCLVVGTSVTTVTKTSDAGAYAATITDASGDADVVTTCDAMTSGYGNAAQSRRCLFTDGTSTINLFDTTTDVTEYTAGITGDVAYLCGPAYTEVTTVDDSGTSTDGNYACLQDSTNLIEKYDSTHTKTWQCTDATSFPYTCTSETQTGYINAYWETQSAYVYKTYSAITAAYAETLASTCLSDGTNTWCDLADGTATIADSTTDAAVATCTAVAADNSQTCTMADNNQVMKYELDGGFTESYVDSTPFASIVCSAKVASGASAGERSCTLTGGCDADTDTPDAIFTMATDGTYTIDLLGSGAGGCVADSTTFGTTLFDGATMSNIGSDTNGSWQ